MNGSDMLKHTLSNNMHSTEVVSRLKALVIDERKITSEILEYLQEVESRKIYARMSYPSLFEFCTIELGYSEGAAQRRISAMRMIKVLPEVKPKIESGALSLSVVSQVQSFFNKKKNLNKPIPQNEKLELLLSLENVSARTCEKRLIQLDPETAANDRERLIDEDRLEIKIIVEKEFIKNLETLKNLLSHQMPYATTKDILSYALRELVKKRDLSLKRKKPDAGHSSKRATTRNRTEFGNIPNPNSPQSLPPTSAVNNSRHISARVKHQVWQSSDAQCCFINPISKRKCGSKRFLEIDHIFPKSLGGLNHTENLQLLCDTHNRLKGALVIN
jgi:5-methylcytosine-specific restriction endonuclease McrA